jgi:DNA-binding MarR family transcriptional regulator
VLWEIGSETGRDVRSLRSRLDLDSGYLSRLLRSLERAGLVTVETAEEDKRVRVARLTPAGVAERGVLDRASDQLAERFLDPLTERQRSRLVVAMADVERLLTAAIVEVAPVDPADPRARHCVRAYFAELDERFDTGFDPQQSIPADDDELRPPRGLLLLAVLRGDPVGCGALKLHDDGPAELKRMWVAPSARGLGLARRLLAELEAHAAAGGARVVRLETNKALVEALALYRSAGYVDVAPFSEEAYAHHWLEKELAPAHAS